jgi:peptidoglycan/LPS O-acetylase OafA/YrhL
MNGETSVVRRHDAALDGVRGLAILAVIALHFDLIRGGFIGVDIFFVLSGFLITAILRAEIERTGRVDYPVFYAKRLLRLVPALALCLVGVAIYSVVTGTGAAAVSPLLAAATYTMNYAYAYKAVGDSLVGHTWSLAVEMQFYLVWPFLFLLLCRKLSEKGVIAFMAGSALACALWRAIVSARYGEASVDFTYRVIETRCDPLLIGGIVALLVRRGTVFASRAVFALACAFIAAVLWRVPAGKVVFHEFGFGLVGLATAYVVGFLASSGDKAVRRAFEVPALRYLGRISYGVYLYHYPIVEGLRQQGVVHAPLWALPITLAAAALSFHFVEAPILRLKPRAPGQGPASTGAALRPAQP